MRDERIEKTEARRRKFVVIDGDSGSVESLVSEAAYSPDALEVLCELYVPKIYSYVYKRVGRIEDAEDITSTVFEKLIANLDSFDGSKASFSTWLYRIALNSVTDFYRSRGRKKEAPLDEVGTVGAVGMEGLDRRLVLAELMEKLPHKYQEALTLRYFTEMKVLEVADTLGITESAASKRILRGLEELRRLAAGGPLEDLL